MVSCGGVPQEPAANAGEENVFSVEEVLEMVAKIFLCYLHKVRLHHLSKVLFGGLKASNRGKEASLEWSAP